LRIDHVTDEIGVAGFGVVDAGADDQQIGVIPLRRELDSAGDPFMPMP
jgi:hypothetical protein